MVSFNGLGYMSPGFHDWTTDQIRDDLVDNFPNSQTRRNIFDGYSRLCRDFTAIVPSIEQWINGSFVTNKIDPNDIDLVSICDKDTIDLLPDAYKAQLANMISGPLTKTQYFCDSYFVARVPQTHPEWPNVKKALDYWETWWGTDRAGIPKGTLRVYIEARDE